MEAPLATLLWITLAAATLGLVATLVVATRRDGRAAALLLLFGGVAGHQALLAGSPPTGDVALDPASLQAAALLTATLGGLLGLLALSRVARERNAAEELHWDAMETLRHVNQLALPGGPEAPLAELLALGARHFDLGLGIVLAAGQEQPAAFHMDPGIEGDPAPLVASLQRYADWSSDRPCVDDAPDPELPAPLARVFIAPMHREGQVVGNLAFASRSPQRRKLTATDKDLLALLAHSAAGLLAPRQDAPENDAPKPPPRARGFAERLLARLEDASVELALEPGLEEAPGAELLLEDIAFGLARGARLVSRDGALRVESGSIRAPQGGSRFITLTVRIADPTLDATALNGVSSMGNGSLESLGEQLRSQGGDVSMSVETGVGASMTAYVPIAAAADEPPSPSDPRPRFLS